MSVELLKLKKRLETDELHRQHWYWGNISKEVVAKALEKHEDGAFIVRDASTKGDYTLTVKFQKKNRLIKIRVFDGCCGFSEDGVTFDTVIDLINYFRRNSLVEYNRMLDTKLLFPVSQVKCVLSPWEVDGANDRRYLVIQLRGLCLELWRTRRFDDIYTKDLENLNEELLQRRQIYAAFESVFKLFYDQWQMLSEKLTSINDEMEEQAIQANLDLQKARASSIKVNHDKLGEQIFEIERQLVNISQDYDNLLSKYETAYANFTKCRFRLLRQGMDYEEIEDLIAKSNSLCITESEELSKVLLQLPLRWQPDRYVLWDSSKSNATKLVREVMECNPDNTDGIFAIRPSQSQEGHFALTVSKDNRVLHCLVEQRDIKHPEACGFGFHNTDIFFPTLVDFVRYYTHHSLKKHNEQLDTRLRIPIFRGTI